MQFKHPELLWALLLLLIPILIHLFQLRKFRTINFTNVKYLKLVELQTRKSSQIKKWLTLLTRLLLLACAIIAFAQPFTSNSENFNSKNEIVIYLDNSFSMEAKGANGSLLNTAIQDIIKSIPNNEELSLFTNDVIFRNTSIKTIANQLIGLKHSYKQLSYNAAYLKGKQLFSKDKSSVKNLILISDFQQKKAPLNFEQDSSITVKLVQKRPKYVSNISLDTLFISNQSPDKVELSAKLSLQGDPVKNVSVSLFNSDTLTAKTAVDVEEEATTTFTIANTKRFNGKISIDDIGLQYDNTLFFNIGNKDKIKVLGINGAPDTFLKKLYTIDEFNYTGPSLKDLNYNIIEAQNLIVLNELESLPEALITALKVFVDSGGHIVIITSDKSDLQSYNKLLKQITFFRLNPIKKADKRITTINYDHVLLRNSFYNRVSNFQYPKVNSFYPLQTSSNAVLSYEDGQPFLIGKDNVFLFTSALNTKNSNFKNSPLIVPALYNLGKQSLRTQDLYYTIGQKNNIDIKVALDTDDILKFEHGTEQLIPPQQTFSKKVSITTTDYPEFAGIYNVKSKNANLKQLSFNYYRSESELYYYNISKNNAYTLANSFGSAIDDIKSNSRINALWKWFVIFALAFLFIEMLILKYLK